MLGTLSLSGALNPQLRDDAEAARSKLSGLRGFYLLTKGGAEALYLDEVLGNFELGKEADFVVLDPNATDVLRARVGSRSPETVEGLSDLLFGLMMLGDDRTVEQTWVDGRLAHQRGSTR